MLPEDAAKSVLETARWTYYLPMQLAAGEVFAGYSILRVLGAGAMGTVYLAQHPRLPRRDALKVLSPELTADPQYRPGLRVRRTSRPACGIRTS
jgi:serine/threonine protein kinase